MVTGMRVTRATTMVTRKMNIKTQGKENLVVGLKDNIKPVAKQACPTRVAARRLSKPKSEEVKEDQPMKVETFVTECQPQRFVCTIQCSMHPSITSITLFQFTRGCCGH
jgi:hypothetical protein